MSNEKKQTLKDLVAMYKKPLYNCAESFESEDVQRPSKRLRKVDTDELDFEALGDDLDKWSWKQKKGRKLMNHIEYAMI